MTGVVTPHQLKEIAGDLRGLLAGFDPDDVTVREAPELWSGLEDIRRLATGAQVLLARRVDESSAPAEAGLRNGAEWIAHVSGGSPSAAYSQLTASRRLAALPVVAAALRLGDLSVGQVEEIAAAGAANPGEAERLVALAQIASLGELRGECARVKAAADPDPDATHERIRQGRRLRSFRDRDGAWCVSGRGTIDAGAEFEVVLRAITDEIFAEAHANGVQETRDAYAFDAAIEMARRAWNHMHTDHTGDVTAGTAVEPPRTRKRAAGVNPKTRAVIRVDLSALLRGGVEGDETSEIAGLGPVPVRVARELLGDANLHLVLTKGTQVANVTATTAPPNTTTPQPLRQQTRNSTGEHRRPLLQRPRPEDLRRLGADHRHRPTRNGPTDRPPPPRQTHLPQAQSQENSRLNTYPPTAPGRPRHRPHRL